MGFQSVHLVADTETGSPRTRRHCRRRDCSVVAARATLKHSVAAEGRLAQADGTDVERQRHNRTIPSL